MTVNKALFLDRDGVVNADRGYVYRREDVVFIPGIFELCRVAKARGFLLFIVTNQAGIGRGYYSERDFKELMGWMCGVFADEHAAIDRVYHCPTHPEHGIGAYKVESPFRKPGPGVILQARDEFNLDLPASCLVGDKCTDIEAGLAAGVGRNFLLVEQTQAVSNTGGNWITVADLYQVESLLP